MRESAIREAVDREIHRWLRNQVAANRPIGLSPDARELLVTIIANIERDPSPIWVLQNTDEAQDRAIALIPVALNRVAERAYSSNERDSPQVTTWEMLHASPSLVDMLCFIPKRRR